MFFKSPSIWIDIIFVDSITNTKNAHDLRIISEKVSRCLLPFTNIPISGNIMQPMINAPIANIVISIITRAFFKIFIA